MQGKPHSLLAEGAVLLAEWFLGEGGEAGAGAEELRQPLALIGRLTFLQWSPAVGTGHLGDRRASSPLGHLVAQRHAGGAPRAEGNKVFIIGIIHHGV